MGTLSPSGAGGVSASSSAAARSGDSTSSSGNKTFNFGGNPNQENIDKAILIVGAIGIIWLLTRNRRKR